MKELVKKVEGRKTLIVIAVAFAIGILEGLEVVDVPNKVWLFLSLAGVGFIKTYANRIEAILKELLKKGEKND